MKSSFPQPAAPAAQQQQQHDVSRWGWGGGALQVDYLNNRSRLQHALLGIFSGPSGETARFRIALILPGLTVCSHDIVMHPACQMASYFPARSCRLLAAVRAE